MGLSKVCSEGWRLEVVEQVGSTEISMKLVEGVVSQRANTRRGQEWGIDLVLFSVCNAVAARNKVSAATLTKLGLLRPTDVRRVRVFQPTAGNTLPSYLFYFVYPFLIIIHQGRQLSSKIS